jgi:hypothetical protein
MAEPSKVPLDVAAKAVGGDPDRDHLPADIFEWRRTNTPLVRVNTAEDALPGGLSMAMAPLIVDWEGSSIGFGPDDYYLVHNVNVSSNPIEGTTVLATVRVPAAAVESAEFVLVMSKLGRFKTKMGHAMLRFIFKPDARPIILDNRGKAVANNAKIQDLVLSWEAWRPPTAHFDPLAGLDPTTYSLTPRCFSGSVRCLTDSILNRPWVAYPLKLPDVPNAADEVLYLGLLLGDALARQTITQLLEVQVKGDDEAQDRAQAEAEDVVEGEAALEESEIPQNPIRDILDGNLSYHLLLRSCVTMALATIDWANVRIHRRGGLPDPPRIRVAPDSLPTALDEIAEGNMKSAFLRIPGALYWLTKNGSAMPGDSYKVLEEAGLLQTGEDGKIARKDYENRHESPYGCIDDNLIY